jgi:ATP-dependent Clp protease protease subunit
MASCDHKEKPRSVEDQIDTAILGQRKLFLSTAVDSDSARDIIRKLWYLDSLDSTKPILLVINSPGGEVHSGMAIWDQIKMISSPVATLVTGLAASFGSILSLAASKGKRLATENAQIMLHQPLIGGVIQGQASDLEIQAIEIDKTRTWLIQVYAKSTGKSIAEIEKLIERDKWLSAQEALEYGLLDAVVKSSKDVEKYLQ